MSSYSPRPNASGDTLVLSRDVIRTNFESLDTVIAVNHVEIGDGDEGKHKFLVMPVSGSNYNNNTAAPTTAASEGGLYVKDDSGGNAQLFYREESNGTERQLTGGTVAAEGSVELPGGTILKWGKATSPGTSGDITFSTPFPTNLFCVTFGIERASSSSTQNVYVDSDGTVDETGFAYSSTSSSSDFYWQAIGN